jgi:hypothetical protein
VCFLPRTSILLRVSERSSTKCFFKKMFLSKKIGESERFLEKVSQTRSSAKQTQEEALPYILGSSWLDRGILGEHHPRKFFDRSSCWWKAADAMPHIKFCNVRYICTLPCASGHEYMTTELPRKRWGGISGPVVLFVYLVLWFLPRTRTQVGSTLFEGRK